MTKPLNIIMPEGEIRIKAMCLIIKDGKILAAKGHDDKLNKDFYRVIGGTLEFGETGEQAVRREIKEELNSDLGNLRRLDVIENIFTYEGRAGHQITFLYIGDLTNQDLYNQETITIQEKDYQIHAEWVPWTDVLDGKAILYPEYDYSTVLA